MTGHRGPRRHPHAVRPRVPLRGEAALAALPSDQWTAVARQYLGSWQRVGITGLFPGDVAALVAAGVADSAQRRGEDGRMELLIRRKVSGGTS